MFCGYRTSLKSWRMPTCSENSSSSCCASGKCGGINSKPLLHVDNSKSASSPSITLKLAVKSSLASLLSTRLSSNGDIAQDVYRAMRDEAHLLLERQFIWDALDSDPFELMRVSSDDGAEDEEDKEEVVDSSVLLDKKKNREMIERCKVSYGNILYYIYISFRAHLCMSISTFSPRNYLNKI